MVVEIIVYRLIALHYITFKRVGGTNEKQTYLRGSSNLFNVYVILVKKSAVISTVVKSEE